MESSYPRPRLVTGGRRIPLLAVIAGALALLVGLLAPLAADAKPKQRGKATTVDVMTRNLYLGADLGPAIAAPNAAGFIAANGQILRDVTESNFPLRARALAAEIRKRKPHLVGLQEVALWRTADPSLDPISEGPSATTVRYDFLQLLLRQVNKGKKGPKYRVAVQQPQFDFEAPADEDGDPGTGILGGEINGRLTMRDAILVRKGKRLRVRNATGGNFENLLTLENVGGVPGLDIDVTRGWTALDATLVSGKKGKKKAARKGKVRRSFRFVNTHLEAFDDRTQVPSIRAQQAAELVAAGGPAARKKVVLLGDMNSDTPGYRPGDEQAFERLLAAGFVRRSTTKPASCCVSDLFNSPPSEFDHVVDHVLTNNPRKVKLRNSHVTGLSRVNGLYPSDHAGVFSRLLLKR